MYSTVYDRVGWHTSFTACKHGHSCLLWSRLKAAKKAMANASLSGCQQAYSTQHRAPLHDFLLQPHWTFGRLHAADAFWTQPTPPPSPLPSSFPLILEFTFTPHKNSICYLSLILRTEILSVIYKQCCISCSRHRKPIKIIFCGNDTAA